VWSVFPRSSLFLAAPRLAPSRRSGPEGCRRWPFFAAAFSPLKETRAASAGRRSGNVALPLILPSRAAPIFLPPVYLLSFAVRWKNEALPGGRRRKRCGAGLLSDFSFSFFCYISSSDAAASLLLTDASGFSPLRLGIQRTRFFEAKLRPKLWYSARLCSFITVLFKSTKENSAD